ncbi:retrotransposon protein [Cucumis melo var. makuwa]|uniref:Retrotransposon protein n=1 Tax=Cucumis melo var. makuwa TaxID=1194695 RepID=A0A5A7V8E6_CUCMM|nr:retrotransposon protein [Cucumis melo var. makuwa]TYK20613.1 retrotransposon protein [Cucumis melo var. makuwa]
MCGSLSSRFRWNDEAKCIIVEKESHRTVKSLLNKSFSYYNEHVYVFGRDKAMGLMSLSGTKGLTCRMERIWSFPPCTTKGLTCPRMIYAPRDLVARSMAEPNLADQSKRVEAAGKERRRG